MKKIGEALLKKLSKVYEPSAMVNLKFKTYDLAVKTDEEGNPVLLFMGKADSEGKIKGDRYARRLLKDNTGKIIKDHWDYKGKV
jgi:predicted peptidase